MSSQSNPIPTTNAEWDTLITQIQSSLPTTYPTYAVPPTLNQTIDHTQLSPTATQADIDTLCTEALTHNFATVCVRLPHVPRALHNLTTASSAPSSSVSAANKPGIACVISFPEGTSPPTEKAREARAAIQAGATELDMVMNYPLLKAGQYSAVYEDLRAVRAAAPGSVVALKVILETAQLGPSEIVAGSVIACLSGAEFIKTSTGFNGAGARVEDVRVMRAVAEILGLGTRVKASGGVRSAGACRDMLSAGAHRIGSSSGVSIMLDSGENRGEEEGQTY
ncbi:2-deoxyribose-5-phosphate aldolase [Aspergillus homomorphus CBS 101889]|uniref:deoxyribose-phosphate aldolase n=1 Tax=Aspergillus homomorphus (strain CBS 101889) TaxID=1450537 RepID=A0A395HSR3_ASPHC|nr:deoxyribose-phosphate aldolase [Aspergillus homomorphus CBS 101889]RAL10586.1 deoxyribose-phosphate aldolase [Aspergillus homomorphus CBS 101889]